MKTLGSIRVRQETIDRMESALKKYNSIALFPISLSQFRRLGIELLSSNILKSNFNSIQDYKKKLPLEYIKKDTTKFLNNFNIIIENKKESLIKNAEEYVIDKFESMGYIASKSNKTFGHPDLIVENQNEKFFVEVKLKNDGLKFSQAKWILDNPDKKVILYFLNIED
jgi:hypothetical protein